MPRQQAAAKIAYWIDGAFKQCKRRVYCDPPRDESQIAYYYMMAPKGRAKTARRRQGVLAISEEEYAGLKFTTPKCNAAVESNPRTLIKTLRGKYVVMNGNKKVYCKKAR